MHRFVRPLTRAFALALAAALVPGVLGAQTAIVAVDEENLRASPNGTILAELLEGARLEAGRREGRWQEVTLEAWIWAPSVEPDDRAGHDLAVSAGDGENLRATPNGRRLGVARNGMLLDRVSTDGRWIRVRRTAWIWAPSIRLTAPSQPGEPAELDVTEPTREFARVDDEVVIRVAPDGDTLTRLRSGTEVEVLDRDGDWVRVRIEGWTFAASLGDDQAEGPVLRDVTRDAMQAEPDQFRGRLVEWTVQFIALEEADQFRTDFLPGERFILARGPGDDAGFVYLAVPGELSGEVATLAPLQRIRVLGRVRTPESRLTGAPVLELLEITGR